MKISNTAADLGVSGTSPVSANTNSGGQTNAVSSNTKSPVESDKVTISSASGTDDDQAGVIDTAKVAHVRQALQNGTYKVNPEVIADKLISNAKELVRGSSS